MSVFQHKVHVGIRIRVRWSCGLMANLCSARVIAGVAKKKVTLDRVNLGIVRCCKPILLEYLLHVCTWHGNDHIAVGWVDIGTREESC